MKILQVVPFFSPEHGGVAVVPYCLSRELAKRGHEVTVFTSDYKLSRKWVESLDKVKIYSFKTWLSWSKFCVSLGMVNRARKEIKHFDLIHMHSCRTFQNIAVHYYAKKYAVPYVLQAHGSLPRIMTKRRLKWIYDVFFGYRILNDTSKVIALTKTEAQQYKSIGVPDEKIEIIPNGIDLSEYADLPPKGSFKIKFNIPDDKKVILYLGRIHEIKGIDFLVKAYARLVNRMEVRDVLLVIAGPDDGYLPKLQALIKSLKLEDGVLISGPLYGRDKFKAYVDADVYVLPSRYETFPMSVLEAVACGTPIILTENCGIADYFRDKAGIVVKPVANNLCEALLEMLLDQEKQNTYRKNCKSAIKEFGISKTVLKLEEVYERVVASFD